MPGGDRPQPCRAAAHLAELALAAAVHIVNVTTLQSVGRERSRAGLKLGGVVGWGSMPAIE
jgi:hypothetical protein